ncbi:MAG: hypothetical protein MJE12_27525 [Alphaproteobacteria bacterium]|nr:hypothetical protein [Alphaproteobacteria bacterium]
MNRISRRIIWLVALLVTLPFVIKAFRDPETQARFDLELAAMEACRAAVRETSAFPDKSTFKIGWRQNADMAKRTVITEGRVTLTSITGEAIPHFYRCLYDGAEQVGEILELSPDRTKLKDKLRQ